MGAHPLWKIYKTKMKCHRCQKTMKFVKKIRFAEYKIDGWECSCGEIVFDSVQAERALLHNKLKKAKIKAKLGQIRSNLILRLPKDVEAALGLHKGEEVELKIEKDGLKVLVA